MTQADLSVEWHETLGSTNDRALELARAGQDRVVVAARAQTAGRGRRGHRWSSPAGCGLYASFLVRPDISAARSPLLTLLFGVAVHDALSPRLSAPIGLKWPNDVLAAQNSQSSDQAVGGKKLAGILVESATAGERLDYAVFGVGVNLTPAAHSDPDAAGRAVSLAELGATDTAAESVLAALQASFLPWLARAEAQEPGLVTEAWTTRALGVGRSIRVRVGGDVKVGRLVGLGPDGGLRVETESGPETLYTGEVDPGSLVG